METVRRAVIDVGTNSIKLLVAEVAGREVRPVWEGSNQTRLGKGFYQTHRLQPAAIAATAQAVAEFAAAARQQQAVSVRVLATSAVREAVNPADLAAAIRAAAGLEVEIISGAAEADLAFQGVTTDPELARQPLLLLDVGGGSTEFILGRGAHKQFSHSFPLGTVRLLERMPHSDPPKPAELAACRHWVREFLRNEVRPKLPSGTANQGPLPSAPAGPTKGVQLVGTGGTATLLGCLEAGLDTFDRERLESTRLRLDRVQWHVQRLWGLPLAARKQLRGLPPSRADVILTGTAIYESIMTEFGLGELRISTRGLRFAAVMAGPRQDG